MKKYPRLDANHEEIESALKFIGASVQSLASIGGGCPDLLVGYSGSNYLLEIKDGEKLPSQRKLTELEMTWAMGWEGESHIIISAEDALIYILHCAKTPIKERIRLLLNYRQSNPKKPTVPFLERACFLRFRILYYYINHLNPPSASP